MRISPQEAGSSLSFIREAQSTLDEVLFLFRAAWCSGTFSFLWKDVQSHRSSLEDNGREDLRW